mmetsp:Transcript_82689/g.242615  ORF Transcript_82689/g.242615 Transcript_82689/m.242615 type:complete len:297 (+) Transcript_82689:38-928(+)
MMTGHVAGAARLCVATGCFSRRFVVPLHRVPPSGEFDLDDLVRGRVDVACRVISAALFLSRDLRHNVELLLPLGRGRPGRGNACGSSPSRYSGVHRALHVSGADLQRLRPDEKSIAAAMRAALRGSAAERTRVRGMSVVETHGSAVRGGLAAAVHRCWSSPSASAAPLAAPGQGPARQDSAVLPARTSSWMAALELCEDGDVDAVSLEARLRELRGEASASSSSTMPAQGGVTVLLGGGKDAMDERDREAFHDWAQREAAGAGVLRVRLGQASLLSSHSIVLLHGLLDRLHVCPSE